MTSSVLEAYHKRVVGVSQRLTEDVYTVFRGASAAFAFALPVHCSCTGKAKVAVESPADGV